MGENSGTTIKDYARSRGITHEAVRRQIKRYAEELEGHITIQGRTKYLDSAAVDFLDQHRLQKTVIVEPTEQETQEEIEGYRAEIERLHKILEEKNEKIISLLSENKDLIQYQTENKLLLEQKERDQEQIQEKDKELTEVRQELQEKQAEVDSYVKSWFGFYRKK